MKNEYFIPGFGLEFFEHLKFGFSRITNNRIKLNPPTIFPDGSWEIVYGGLDTKFELKLKIFKPTGEEEHETKVVINCYLLKIISFELMPIGEGHGTKIIKYSLKQLKNSPFRKVILRSEGERSTKFLEEQGIL